ncbi:MAG: sigma-54-dependent Fis family transcriptional regulator [Chitinophagia bacterium]|nr:sigma-54-dependent Fis family transcriptional regulator [Chitinophagia bacterium]
MTEIQSIKNRFGIIGNSPALNYALSTAIQVAATDLSVLIVGESGVGKEVFSNIIHSLSTRKHNNFIAVNCGAIPEGTIDSELFGHEKGSFTGASEGRKGYFETVNGGTIFLDEIGEMPLGTQARLLRVLETGEFIRVGSSKVQKTNVRVIAATNRNLLEVSSQYKFREDLYYRLSTVPIKVPALRDRREDVPLLFRKFATDFAEKYRTTSIQLDPAAQQLLMNHAWRGNVRELKNIAEQLSVLSADKYIGVEALRQLLPGNDNQRSLAIIPNGANNNYSQPQDATTANERDILFKLFFELKKDMNDLKHLIYDVANHQGYSPVEPAGSTNLMPIYSEAETIKPLAPYPNSNNTPLILDNSTGLSNLTTIDETLSLMDREKEFISKALKKHKNRRKDAATELGISERTLYRKIKEYGIIE